MGYERSEISQGIRVFFGSSSLSMDAKGRLSIPTRHRDVLLATAGGALTITRSPEGCLLIYPRPEWDKFCVRVLELPMSAQWWKRMILGSAMEVQMDAAGRVLVSPELRAAAGLARSVQLRGVGPYLELWDQASYLARETDGVKGNTPDLPDAIKNFVV